MTHVKLCGLMCEQDVAVADALQADYIGFVLADSRRRVSVKDVVEWLKRVKPVHSRPVFVTVNPDLDEIVRMAQETGIHHIQLSGEETPEFCLEARRQGLIIWKAIGIGDSCDIERINRYRAAVDALLLDTKRAGTHGGTGETFPWSLIPACLENAQGTPLFIAGGLTPSGVARLLATHRVHGVDVSSGIESDGQKDPAKMREFVHEVRRIDRVSG
ncbi:phosphoribosylanthranilate isomerase [Ferroacidibacillus organovorans]|uniref:N-(5'-phosphoribosyl)anthranilate isomerase n=1 Tax=Ferroacidibacillus organovorans TaxID=1765683 RepID=A0A117SYE9_9BACL|nr:phosphoribosylanthranilate isomerase [Ferroacidibacillus organovorans]KUO96858.1 hypothetical protein ATW55_08610 [Ferroacidibacillus organovorans]